jgi:chaperone required for assembly of F1-ATPase
MTAWAQKRFWETAEVHAVGEGFEVRLDGRKLRTPQKSELHVPTLSLATEIANEWQAQEDKIDPESMPVTRMANSAIDKVAPQFDAVAALVAAYGESDLLCYRAAFPVELVAKQAECWDPYLQWAESNFGASLETGVGVMHVTQPKRSIDILNAEVHALTPFELACFHDLVSISGSLILGLAVSQNFKSVDEIWRASRVDEDWQESQWGEDDEAVAYAKSKRQGFSEAYNFFKWLQKAP